MKSAIQTFTQHTKRYTPAYLRAVAYIALAAIVNFDDTFSSLTREQASSMTWWGWACMSLKPVGAALTATIAFLDQTLARINAATPPTSP